MKGKATYIILLLLILIAYSSEIAFLPNYEYRPDQWHLFKWVPLIGISLIIILIANLIQMSVLKKINAKVLVILLLTLSFFGLLNTTNSNSKQVSFIAIALFLLYTLFSKSFKKQSP